MAKKRLEDCKTNRDFENYAKRKEREGKCTVSEGGNHTKVNVPGYRGTVISRGSREPSPGLRRSMIKQFIEIGLGVLVLFGPVLYMILAA